MNIYIDTLGCPKNFCDSEGAAGVMEKEGHKIVCSPQEADVILINTCGFIRDAKEESIDHIIELSELKKEGVRLIVSGCLTQRYGEELHRELPEIDVILGVNDYDKLTCILSDLANGKKENHLNHQEGIYVELGKRKNLGPSHTSYLKIAEGCDNVCAYCIIPQIRGGYRSREKERILEEARQLVSDGCKEIILVAQDVTAYGTDLMARINCRRCSILFARLRK